MNRPAMGGDGGWRGLSMALAVFGLATLSSFSALWGADPTRETVANVVTESRYEGDEAWDSLGANDLRFVTWQIARNARVLIARPFDLFDSEICHPTERAMTYGESAIALGVIGVPAWWTTRDPVVTFSFVVVALHLIGAIGMFLLVRAWTGVPAAAIAAGVLYAYHEVKLGDVIHLYVWDDVFTVYALYFATRLFETGRLREAVALSLTIAMRAAGSMYPMMGAVLIAIPFVPWLLVTHGIARQRLLPWTVLVSTSIGWVLLLLGPYFARRAVGGIAATEQLFYRSHEYLLPSGDGFPGIVMLALLVSCFALGARRCLREEAGDPRWVLALAALILLGLSVLVAPGTETGVVGLERGAPSPSGFPNLFMLVSSGVPGFEVGRSPGALYTDVHLLMCALAGLGAAGIVRIVPLRIAAAASVGLVTLAFLDTVRPPSLGFDARVDLRRFALRPAEAELAFFETLADRGDAGPVIELPMVLLNFERASESILRAAYHQRPVAHCYNSFFPEISSQVEMHARAMPSPEAIRALGDFGFTTVVVHHPAGDPFLARRHERFRRFEGGPHAHLLERLHATPTMTAYRIAKRRGEGVAPP